LAAEVEKAVYEADLVCCVSTQQKNCNPASVSPKMKQEYISGIPA